MVSEVYQQRRAAWTGVGCVGQQDMDGFLDLIGIAVENVRFTHVVGAEDTLYYLGAISLLKLSEYLLLASHSVLRNRPVGKIRIVEKCLQLICPALHNNVLTGIK